MNDEMRDDIRAISEDLLADSKRLAEIERAKLDPDSTKEDLERLAGEAAELTRRMAAKANVEERVANDLS
jgi:phosphoglycerate-specific signal transduction histidine kinase